VSQHTLSVLVEDTPGALARIAGLFSRRGFNIESLAVGRTEIPGISRMTIVVNVEALPLEQVTKQLNKLINVIKIVELEPASSVERQLLLVKVKADATTRGTGHRDDPPVPAKAVDVGPDSITIEVTGDPGKLAAILRVLEPFGIRELVQSARSPSGAVHARSPTGHCGRSAPAPEQDLLTSLPHRPPAEEHSPWPRCSTTMTPTCP
jgi:acetolactate synthase-1/3 small subunit